jgi:hypothetical protein
MTEEEEFYAWLDGELGAGRAARVAERVAASPELTAKAAEHRRLAAQLRGAFEPVMAADVSPPRFDAVVDFGSEVAKRQQRPRVFGMPQWAAMAATLALGLLVGNLVGGGNTAPVAVEGGHLVAAASLEQALDTQLASAPLSSDARIGLTFRDGAGNICRSFEEGATSGLACREGEQWLIEGLFQRTEGQTADYRMATGQDARLAELIAARISGAPFDAAQERVARDKDWR